MSHEETISLLHSAFIAGWVARPSGGKNMVEEGKEIEKAWKEFLPRFEESLKKKEAA